MKHNYLYSVLAILIIVTFTFGVLESYKAIKNNKKILVNASLIIKNPTLFSKSALQLTDTQYLLIYQDYEPLSFNHPTPEIWTELSQIWQASTVSQSRYNQDNLARLYYMWGLSIAQNEDLSDSLTWFQAARKTAPWWSYLWIQEAKALIDLNQPQAAKNLLILCQENRSSRPHCSETLSNFQDLATFAIDFQYPFITDSLKP